MFPFFGYYQNPNQVNYGFYLRKYPTTLGGILRPFSSTSVGYKWNYAKNDSLYYLRQEMKAFYQNRVRTVFQETSAGKGVEVNVNEALRKSSLKFEIDLWPESRPKIFRHSFITDPDNFAYLKFTTKNRKNKVDTDHCSTLLMQRALNNDQLYTAKMGVKFNQAYDHEIMAENISF